MTSHELYQHQIRTYNECLKIFRAKNADYAADYGADDTDPFRAFKFSEFAGICTVEQEIMSRVAEKLMRTSNLMFGEHEAQVKDEDIR